VICYGRVYGPVVRDTAVEMNEWMNEWMSEWMLWCNLFGVKTWRLNHQNLHSPTDTLLINSTKL
jgi:hypothetical protein